MLSDDLFLNRINKKTNRKFGSNHLNRVVFEFDIKQTSL